MDNASSLDILLWNWEPLAITLTVGLIGVVATAFRMARRQPVRTVLVAVFWSVLAFGTGAALLVSNSRDAHYAVANAHDPSPTFVLDVWQAEQVVTLGILASVGVSVLALAALGIVAARRAV